MAGITFDGLNSGIDTAAIVEGLLDIQQTQLDRTELKRQGILQQQAAFQSLEAQLVSFRSSASTLSKTRNNVFEAKTISVSDENAILATASSDAAPGVYQLTVDSFARAHQVASQGFASDTSEITQGTFTLQQGDRPPAEITIDGSNNTVQGLVDAINLAGTDVQAALIKDGSTTDPYRILLTSSETGEANAITLTNSLAADSGDAVKPTFDFGVPVQEATNAAVRLGSGAGAIVIENSTNELDDIIPGVSLEVLQQDEDKTITLKIGQDTGGAIEAVQNFVDSYNSLTTFINDQTRYSEGTGEAGLLLGNRSVIQIQNQLQSELQKVVPGLNTSVNRLSTVGIGFTDQGTLTFDSSKLKNVLEGEVEGASANDVKRLFALDGASTNQGIEFILGTSRTQETDSPIEVDISQAAEQASITSTNSLAGGTIVNSFNNELTLSLDGASLDVTLAEGFYSDEELAAQLESVINAHPDAAGRRVIVGVTDDGAGGNKLTITSGTYGESSKVQIESGSALVGLGLSGSESDEGVDVAGVFRINGKVEQATGRGRVLVGERDNEFTDDLQVRVTLTADQITSDSEGELSITRGTSSRLGRLIANMQNSESGILKTVNDRFEQQAEDILDSIEQQKEIFDTQEQELLAQFVALESALTELKSTENFLTQQFAQLSSVQNKK